MILPALVITCQSYKLALPDVEKISCMMGDETQFLWRATKQLNQQAGRFVGSSMMHWLFSFFGDVGFSPKIAIVKLKEGTKKS